MATPKAKRDEASPKLTLNAFLPFRLVVLGEQYRHSPAIFEEARPGLEPNLLQTKT